MPTPTPLVPTPTPPVWLDTGVLIEIDKRGFPYAETVINELKKDGHEVLLPPSVEHEFLRPAPSGKKWAHLRRQMRPGERRS